MFEKLFLHKKKTRQFNGSQTAKAQTLLFKWRGQCQLQKHNSYSSNGGVNVLEITDDVLELGIINNGEI